MSPQLEYLKIITRGHLARVRDDERGVSAVEWILITLALIAMAGVVAGIITSRIQDRAGDVNL
jgi:hypothetical protein